MRSQDKNIAEKSPSDHKLICVIIIMPQAKNNYFYALLNKTMRNNLLSGYENYCKNTTAELEVYLNMPNAQFQQEHIVGKWSMAQVFDHLLTVEKGTLMYLLKKAQSEELQNASFRTWLYGFLLRKNLKSAKKFRLPAVLPQPSNEKTAQQLLTELADIRTKMANFIEAWPKQKYRKLVFKHPRAGMLTLQQTLNFIADHWQHHKPQLADLNKAASTN